MEKELNGYRHFFLYAKGWYRQTDLIDDLKTIISDRCMVEKQYVTNESIYSVLSKAIQPYFDHPSKFERFSRMLWDIGRGNIFATEMISIDIAFIKTAMSIMFDAVPQSHADNTYSMVISGSLGTPDEKVLPLREKNKH